MVTENTFLYSNPEMMAFVLYLGIGAIIFGLGGPGGLQAPAPFIGANKRRGCRARIVGLGLQGARLVRGLKWEPKAEQEYRRNILSWVLVFLLYSFVFLRFPIWAPHVSPFT